MKRSYYPVDSAQRLSTFAFVSSCPEDWGGSEELWAQTAILLAQLGHSVAIFKTNANRQHPRIHALLAANCRITDLCQVLPLPIRLRNRLLRARGDIYTHSGQHILKQHLRALQPRLTIIAQGNNYDGAAYADICRRYGHPYVLIAQKAVHFFFPLDGERTTVQAAYQSALRCFFVSHHNLHLTRQQLSMVLPQAEVIFNPVNPFLQKAFSNQTELAPAPDGPLRLACVARLDILDKGQDMLLSVLATPKWRSRSVTVTLFGSGPHRQALTELIQFLDLSETVFLGGQVADPATIWQTHHALVLPSRSEGLPLALVETMLCGRPAIATSVGGVAELLIDNVTGFLAATPTVDALDEALERAWFRRAEWPQLGLMAAQHVRATVPANAAALFRDQLLQLGV